MLSREEKLLIEWSVAYDPIVEICKMEIECFALSKVFGLLVS